MASTNGSLGNLALRVRMRRRYVDDLDRPAVVFAPHPDDETLGCGGTIARKLAQGAKVNVVFITDGSRSSDMLPEVELAKLRREEALKACQSLGVEEGRVQFLGLEDGRIGEEESKATAMVAAVLNGIAAQEVFVTHRDEPTPDHAATNRIVRRAIGEIGRPMRVWEYPIWYWDRWPWILLDRGYRRHPWALAKSVGLGLPVLLLPARLNCAVDVDKQLEAKRAALAHHRTQMTRYNGDEGWRTLGDVAGGQFLDLLLQPQEYFLRYEVPARKAC